jgi:hypothetical protein
MLTSWPKQRLDTPLARAASSEELSSTYNQKVFNVLQRSRLSRRLMLMLLPAPSSPRSCQQVVSLSSLPVSCFSKIIKNMLYKKLIRNWIPCTSIT